MPDVTFGAVSLHLRTLAQAGLEDSRQQDTPAVRGMIDKVRHLVSVEEV